MLYAEDACFLSADLTCTGDMGCLHSTLSIYPTGDRKLSIKISRGIPAPHRIVRSEGPNGAVDVGGDPPVQMHPCLSE